MRIRLAIPDQHVSAGVLDAALEAATRAAQAQMQAGEGPTFSDMIRSGVRWRPERFQDGEHFDLPAIVGARGWGDCDDLSCALAAELRAQDPGARARVVPTGKDRWHAIVQLSDGTIVDPSQIAGMRRPVGLRGAIARPMAGVGESALTMMQHKGQWWTRTDLPWDDGHLASIASDPDLPLSLDRSVAGAVRIGRCVTGWPDEGHLTVLGELWNAVGDFGEDFGGAIIRAAEKAAEIVKQKAQEQQAKQRAARGSGEKEAISETAAEPVDMGRGARALCTPGGGPIIVRF